jgi:hypothetical protein
VPSILNISFASMDSQQRMDTVFLHCPHAGSRTVLIQDYTWYRTTICTDTGAFATCLRQQPPGLRASCSISYATLHVELFACLRQCMELPTHGSPPHQLLQASSQTAAQEQAPTNHGPPILGQYGCSISNCREDASRLREELRIATPPFLELVHSTQIST